MSNFDIEKWVKQLKIKNFRGVFSRNNLPKVSFFNECGIINLDSFTGPGTHWVCYVKNNTGNQYFDSFGLQSPKEVINYLPGLKFNNIQYQSKDSFLCGYYCLFFIKMLQDNVSMYDILYKVLHVNNSKQNEQTIVKYFKSI